MTDHVAGPPPALRAAIARDLAPVRPLASPVARVAAMIPVAIVLLLAAPLVFSFRDLDALGLVWSWGASVLQVMAGLALTVAALRESVPGRTWSSLALWLMAAAAVGIVVGTTLASWQLSPVAIRGAALIVGAMCMASSAITALPATLLAVVLAMRAYPMRPVVTGWLVARRTPHVAHRTSHTTRGTSHAARRTRHRTPDLGRSTRTRNPARGTRNRSSGPCAGSC
jgi:hypothetical protein